MEMNAIIYRKYGPPDVLTFEEISIPQPGENEVLLKVVAVSANPLDWHSMRFGIRGKVIINIQQP